MDNKKNIISRFSRTLAFTLAEVIIVIGIIGIVAEMVIPGVIASTSDSISLAMVKEDFSILQQAIKMAETNEGRICDWYNGPDDRVSMNAAINQVLSKYLKVAKNCGATQGCFSPNLYKWLSPSSTALNATTWYSNLDNSPNIYSNMILANGSSLAIWQFSVGGSNPNSYITCIYFVIDVNGLKAPNRWGYDTFMFYIFSYPDNSMKSQMLMPFGNPYQNDYATTMGCYSNASPANAGGGGLGCAVWAVSKNTVKYKNGEILP